MISKVTQAVSNGQGGQASIVSSIAPSSSLTFRLVGTSVRHAELLALIERCYITVFEDERKTSHESRNLVASLLKGRKSKTMNSPLELSKRNTALPTPGP